MRRAIAEGEELVARQRRMIRRLRLADADCDEALTLLVRTKFLVDETRTALKAIEADIARLEAMPAYAC
jgi:hypothetical protein